MKSAVGVGRRRAARLMSAARNGPVKSNDDAVATSPNAAAGMLSAG